MAKPDIHSHYFRYVGGLEYIDYYRLADLYAINHPCQAHVFKKIICTGERGHKELQHDIQDMIDTLERWKDMIQEDEQIANKVDTP